MKWDNDKADDTSGFNWRTLLWIAILILFIGYLARGFNTTGDSNQISYSAFKQAVAEGRVTEVTIRGDIINGRYVEPQKKDGARQNAKNDSKQQQQPETFTTVKPDVQDPALLPLLQDQHVTINAETTQSGWGATLLAALLPWILIIGIFLYAGRKMRERVGGGQGGLFGFTRSRAKEVDLQNVDVHFEDVAGLDNAKKELQEIVDYLKDSKLFRKLGATLPKGILLVGPPGVGKTLMAKATAGEAKVAFYSISGSEFIEMFVGVGASRVRDLFKRAKATEPSIIFIDELDSIGRIRGTGLGGGNDEREQTLNQILSEMDGFSPRRSIVILAATNRPDVLDPALIRPGRFDRQITLELPQKKARRAILKTHVRNVPLADDVNLADLADRTVGLSGADLKNLVNEAALIAARKKKDLVEAEDFESARDKILMGIEREDVLNEEEKQIVAYHEAGHAILAKLLPGADPLQKVSIIPRGRALGVTEQVPEEDRHNLKRSYLYNRIAIMLGGRVAEKLVFGDTSTGASDDLKRATQIARRMVCEWGMSEKIGPVTFSQSSQHPFLGRDISEPKDFSEYTGRIIDEEVEKIVRGGESEAENMLKENQDKLVRLAQELLAHETLSREEVDRLMA